MKNIKYVKTLSEKLNEQEFHTQKSPEASKKGKWPTKDKKIAGYERFKDDDGVEGWRKDGSGGSDESHQTSIELSQVLKKAFDNGTITQIQWDSATDILNIDFY